MKRRTVIRAAGTATTLGVTATTMASARPNCDYCEEFDSDDCPDECDHIGCNCDVEI